MSKPPFQIKAGFVPYSDGSGFQVDVAVEQEYAGADTTMSNNTIYPFDVTEWPEIRDGIERLLKAAPTPPVFE
jgi:hypothetical protein